MSDIVWFVNQNWGLTEEVLSSYTSLGIDVTLYQNTDYALYLTFLDSVEASQKIDEDVPYLTSNALSNFK